MSSLPAQLDEPRWRSIPRDQLPRTEALVHCQARVMPYWNEVLVPALKAGRTLLIVAHGNSLRSLVKHLDKIPDHEIAELNIPTGFPLVYELDDQLRVVKREYLGDASAASAAAAAVANQAKGKSKP
jgi:2,3-bisphosphoglycerate-dependent phosphoglycerate mutase